MSVEILNQKKYFLSDLYPRKLDQKYLGKALVDRVQEFKLIVDKANQACVKLQAGEFERFDGIVGESACQIRAVKISLIGSKNLIDLEAFSKRLKQAEDNINFSLTYPERKKFQKIEQSLGEFINSRQINVPLTSDEYFSIQCFILNDATVLVDEIEGGIEYMSSLARKLDHSLPLKILPEDSSISNNFVRDLVVHLKTNVSRMSVEFVQDAAEKLLKNEQSLMLGRMIQHDAHNAHLVCIPFFYSMKTLLQVAHKNNIPLVLRVKFLDKELPDKFRVVEKKSIFFKPSEKSELSYHPSVPTIEDFAKPACVIEGCSLSPESDWKIMKGQYPISDAILSFVAAHQQYPGNHNEQEDFQDPELNKFKNLAEVDGFSQNNPSTLFLQHIYSSKPNRDEFLPKKLS